MMFNFHVLSPNSLETNKLPNQAEQSGLPGLAL